MGSFDLDFDLETIARMLSHKSSPAKDFIFSWKVNRLFKLGDIILLSAEVEVPA